MSETRATKVKFDGSKVRIEYEKKRLDGHYDEYTLSSLDSPSLEFQNALKALAMDAVTICELDGKDVDKLTVRGVTLTYTNDIMGACITALKKLETSNAPLVLNTPHLPSEAYGDGDVTSPVLEPSTVSRLVEVAEAALRFIDGERAQGNLFVAGSEVEAPAEQLQEAMA
jgi:hypothetical protein